MNVIYYVGTTFRFPLLSKEKFDGACIQLTSSILQYPFTDNIQIVHPYQEIISYKNNIFRAAMLIAVYKGRPLSCRIINQKTSGQKYFITHLKYVKLEGYLPS